MLSLASSFATTFEAIHTRQDRAIAVHNLRCGTNDSTAVGSLMFCGLADRPPSSLGIHLLGELGGLPRVIGDCLDIEAASELARRSSLTDQSPRRLSASAGLGIELSIPGGIA